MSEGTDLVIEGTEKIQEGYEWTMSGTDCVDQIREEKTKFSNSTGKREWMFSTPGPTIKGMQCSINFFYKLPYKSEPDSIRDVKKAILIFI